jgi:hypothetical protein
MSAIKQGCSREHATLDWREFCDALRASFSEEDTYEALERKLKQIKYNPLRSEAFFFQISNLLDQMGIGDTDRRIALYLKQLLPDIGSQVALSSPKDDNEVFAKLRSLDKFHRNKLINEEAVNVVVNEEKESTTEVTPKDTFATEIASAICCARTENPGFFNRRGRGQPQEQRNYNNNRNSNSGGSRNYNGNSYNNNNGFNARRNNGRGRGNYRNMGNRENRNGTHIHIHNEGFGNRRGGNPRGRGNRGRTEDRSQDNSAQNRACFVCGAFDHFKINCPQRNQNVDRDQGNDRGPGWRN